jgi:hypothetical protein
MKTHIFRLIILCAVDGVIWENTECIVKFLLLQRLRERATVLRYTTLIFRTFIDKSPILLTISNECSKPTNFLYI